MTNDKTKLDDSISANDDSPVAIAASELLFNLDYIYGEFDKILPINKKNSISSSKNNLLETVSLIEKNQLDESYTNTIGNDIGYFNKRILNLKYDPSTISQLNLENTLPELVSDIFQMSTTNLRLLKIYLSTKNHLVTENKKLKNDVTTTNQNMNKILEENTLLKIESENTHEKLKQEKSMSNKLNNNLNTSILERSKLTEDLNANILELEKTRDEVAELKNEKTALNERLQKELNKDTESIYDTMSQYYGKLENKYRWSFFITIAVVGLISIVLFNVDIQNDAAKAQFIVLKISMVLIGVTLISYFIKQASHYQKLSEKNKQTHIELIALPSFIADMPQNDIYAIRKDLSSKYFGQEIDGSPHKDMSNLISDQMKNATELVKASAAMVKSINQPASKPKDTDTK